MTAFLEVLCGIPIGIVIHYAIVEWARLHEQNIRDQEFSVMYGALKNQPLTWPEVRPEKQTYRNYRAIHN